MIIYIQLTHAGHCGRCFPLFHWLALYTIYRKGTCSSGRLRNLLKITYSDFSGKKTTLIAYFDSEQSVFPSGSNFGFIDHIICNLEVKNRERLWRILRLIKGLVFFWDRWVQTSSIFTSPEQGYIWLSWTLEIFAFVDPFFHKNIFYFILLFS